MADSIFDGCRASRIGMGCDCTYCSFIKNTQRDAFPEGFPEWMKDYRALQVLKSQNSLATNLNATTTSFNSTTKTTDDQITANTADIAALKTQVTTNAEDIAALKTFVKFDPKKTK